MVILNRPLLQLWQNHYIENGLNNNAYIITISFILEILSIFVLIILGENRLKMVVVASFVYSIIRITTIPVIYFITAVINPTNIENIFDLFKPFSVIYYIGHFITNIIIITICFLASYLLRDTQEKPSFKLYSLFALFFVVFTVIVNVWWWDITVLINNSYLVVALLGTLLLGVLIIIFYLYTRLISKTKNADTYEKNNFGDHLQYIKQLSIRELELLEAVLAGNKRYKEIAAALNIAVNTVKTHIKNIYRITGVSNIQALILLFRDYTPPKSPKSHPKIT